MSVRNFFIISVAALGLAATTGISNAQPIPIDPDWKISATGGAGTITYPWFSANNCRGMAYNPVTGNLIVASRQGGNGIYVLDADDGSVVKTMNVTGIAGGTYPINKVGVSEDGQIYVCNLITVSSTTPSANFKIYRWPSEDSTAAPTVAVTSNLTFRHGDGLSVIGSGNDIKILTGGGAAGANSLGLYTTSDSGATFARAEVPLPTTPTPAVAGASSQQPWWDPSGQSIWIKTSQTGTTNHIDLTGAHIGDSPYDDNTFVGSDDTMSGIAVTGSGTDRYIAYAYGTQLAGNTTPCPVKKLDATNGLTGDALWNLEHAEAGAITGGAAVRNIDRNSMAAFGGDNSTVFLLNIQNSIAKYSDAAIQLPVSLSSFSIE